MAGACGGADRGRGGAGTLILGQGGAERGRSGALLNTGPKAGSADVQALLNDQKSAHKSANLGAIQRAIAGAS